MSDKYMLSKAVYYGTYFEIKDYTTPIMLGNRKKDKKKYVKPDFDIIDELPKYERRVDNLGQCRKKVYDIISCNVLKYPKFLTLTCAESILNYNDFLYQVKLFFKNMKRKGYDLKYLWVAERQTNRGKKEGNEGSYHAHVIIFNDEYIPFDIINSCWNGNTDIHIFESVRYIDNNKTDEKINDVAGYVTKYITKENLNEFGRNCYHCSRGLFRPIEVRNTYTQYIGKNEEIKYIRNDNDEQNLSFDEIKKKMIVYYHKPYMRKISDDKFVCCDVIRGKISSN